MYINPSAGPYKPSASGEGIVVPTMVNIYISTHWLSHQQEPALCHGYPRWSQWRQDGLPSTFKGAEPTCSLNWRYLEATSHDPGVPVSIPPAQRSPLALALACQAAFSTAPSQAWSRRQSQL